MNLLVVGAGPVGATFALLAARAGLTVSMLEAREGASRETRSLALSHGSHEILVRAGVNFPALAATEIHRIHTSHQGSFGHAVISREDGGVPALGYVAQYASLQTALDATLVKANVAVMRGAVVAAIDSAAVTTIRYTHQGALHTAQPDIVVFADGGANLDKLPTIITHEKDYGQVALLAHIEADRPHQHMAYERFTPQGPAALLPMATASTVSTASTAAAPGNANARDCYYSLVWVAAPAQIEDLKALDDAAFCHAFQQHFGNRAGKFVSVSGRRSYPLRLRTVIHPVAGRAVVIGNAAQALHPVAGQGFNLGLRDASDLANVLAHALRDPRGAPDALAAYAQARARDVSRSVGFTDFLVSAFASDSMLARVPRGLGLVVLDLMPRARRMLARRMLFGAPR